jgi:hypothetical protein
VSAPRLAEGGFRRIWRRWWFHLGALMVLVPAIYLKSYIDLQAMFIQSREEGLRATEIIVGPWQLQLQERSEEEPFWDPREGWVKQFRVIPCAGCADKIRAIFISLKRPGSSEYGVPFEGNPYRSFGDMKLGRNPAADDKVWITAEGWDGSLHQTALSLDLASPVTVRWLNNR